MKFFSSDLHLFHKFISIERGYNDPLIMNEEILDIINSIVREDDEFYILGDLSFGKPEETMKWVDRLICKNIYLIRGNHDNKKQIEKIHGVSGSIEDRFIWVRDYYVLKIKDEDISHGNQFMVLFHFPMITWDNAHHGSWHLCGHSHGSLDEKFNSTRLDIGWDCWGRPISYEDIKRHMKNKSYLVVDHHIPNVIDS